MSEKKSRGNSAPGILKKKPVWFYFIMIVIPAGFFIALELGLRVFNYGEDYSVIVNVSDEYPAMLNLNPKLTSKYFHNLRNTPGFVPDAFDKVKKPNAFRVFVLGESSTAGWPYMFTISFPADLKRKLEILYPENKIEVINCGASAINSYTIRDIAPVIAEQEPDLILIYTGHNEYYGALGAASVSSLDQSRSLINLYLWSLKFRTVQLLEEIISSVSSLFNTAGRTRTNPETLMEHMAGESLIPLNSELYERGINQFDGNMRDILEEFNEKEIPVIIANLTCNIRDLDPFVSVKEGELPRADSVYSKAKQEYEEGNFTKAAELFFYAKELDALRFRAPEEINNKIRKLAEEYGCGFVDVDSVFRSASEHEITGNNLITDHLHPDPTGHKLIADAFFIKMEEVKTFPDGERILLQEEKQDSILKAVYPYTAMDSVIAYLRTIQLTGAYPFVPKGEPNRLINNFKMNNFVDSTAFRVLRGEISWGEAHTKAAERFYKEKQFDLFLKEVNSLIAARPYSESLYEGAVTLMLESKLFNEAEPYLIKLNSIRPSFFTSKWLGDISLQKKNYNEAKKFLEKALSFSENDYQVWYNLAGIYFYEKDYGKSLAAVERSLNLNPENALAKNVYRMLKNLNRD